MDTERSDELGALRAEVDALKARQRWATRGLLALVGIGVLLGADRPMSVVQADRFEVLGPAGEVVMVFEHDGDAPSLVVRHGDAWSRLSADGLEVSAVRADPDALPTVEDAGMSAEGVRTAWVDVGDTYVSSMEVLCEQAGFRERAAFVQGRAVIELPEGVACVAVLKGGLAYPRIPIVAGSHLMCAGSGMSMRCRGVQ